MFTGLGVFAPVIQAQSASGAGAGSALVGNSPTPKTKASESNLTYVRPTERTKFLNYINDTFGPVPIGEAIIVAAGNQYENTPHEWGQGFGPYTQRVASNFGIAAITTTTRYGLAEAFREDTMYYRCECTGLLRRFKHAMLSTVMARHGEDGHWRFSLSTLAAPYVGNMAGVYGWYPSRYGARDWIRMGSYDFLAFSGDNVFLEFIYGGPHTLFGHLFHRQQYPEANPGPASPR
jgi:hypothetical protein